MKKTFNIRRLAIWWIAITLIFSLLLLATFFYGNLANVPERIVCLLTSFLTPAAPFAFLFIKKNGGWEEEKVRSKIVIASVISVLFLVAVALLVIFTEGLIFKITIIIFATLPSVWWNKRCLMKLNMKGEKKNQIAIMFYQFIGWLAIGILIAVFVIFRVQIGTDLSKNLTVHFWGFLILFPGFFPAVNLIFPKEVCTSFKDFRVARKITFWFSLTVLSFFSLIFLPNRMEAGAFFYAFFGSIAIFSILFFLPKKAQERFAMENEEADKKKERKEKITQYRNLQENLSPGEENFLIPIMPSLEAGAGALKDFKSWKEGFDLSDPKSYKCIQKYFPLKRQEITLDELPEVIKYKEIMNLEKELHLDKEWILLKFLCNRWEEFRPAFSFEEAPEGFFKPGKLTLSNSDWFLNDLEGTNSPIYIALGEEELLVIIFSSICRLLREIDSEKYETIDHILGEIAYAEENYRFD